MGGVDLAREDRQRKADACTLLLLNFFKAPALQKALKRKGEVGEVAMELHTELQSFLNKTRAE